MKKAISGALTAALLAGMATAVPTVSAAGTDISFDTEKTLYAHAVSGSEDTEGWTAMQKLHDDDMNVSSDKNTYFFLPSSADESQVEIYNATDSSVKVGDTTIPSKQSASVNYSTDMAYDTVVNGNSLKLYFMRSSAEAAIFVNNTDADGNGTDLMDYINRDKSISATATGAIIDKDGNIDNTPIKKIKGRGNTTWDKSKKPYNITYDSKVSIAGMSEGKKYSLLANYQDDSLSRNRVLYDMSDAVGMPYASDSRYVDFYVNGYYWGSYQIAQKVEAGKNDLVNDIDDSAYINEDGTINDDFPFVCEVDPGAQDGNDNYVNCDGRLKITIKSPELSKGDPGYNEVREYVKSQFNYFYNACKDSKGEKLEKIADIDSLTKIYLINELGKNWDSGVSSLFFTFKQDENGVYKFFGSPVWDYDNSLGNCVGIGWDLSNFGVNDYEEYTGWWCKYKGRSKGALSSNNIMNLIANNDVILEAAPEIWFEDFVPAIQHFSGEKTNDSINAELYTKSGYYSLIKGSAEMNYKSGWLLDTGDWICDHSNLKTASFDYNTKKYTVSSSATKYPSTFDGMYNYMTDWLESRAAWLSDQMKDGYTEPQKPQPIDGDDDLVVLGDSIATGYGLDGYESGNNTSAKDSFANIISSGRSSYNNFAIDGLTAAGFLSYYNSGDSFVEGSLKNAEKIVVSIGGNDVIDLLFSEIPVFIEENKADIEALGVTVQNDTPMGYIYTYNTLAIVDKSGTVTSKFGESQNSKYKTAIANEQAKIAEIIAELDKANPDAEKYYLTVFNPFSGARGWEGIAALVDSALEYVNESIKTSVSESDKSTVVEVAEAFDKKSEQYTNIPNWDIHPNKAGHKLISDLLTKAFAGDEPVIVPGDVTGDGIADIADALKIARYDAKLDTLTFEQQKAADVNGDGSADIADSLLVARKDAKLI